MKQWIYNRLKPWVAQRLEWFLLLITAYHAKNRRCKENTGKVLIARTDGLGDFVLWLDAQIEIRNMFPDKKLVMMLDSTKPTKELAKKIPHIDQVIVVNIHNYIRFFEVFRMRRQSYDIIIQPVYGRTAFTDILLFSCRADLRITLDGNNRFLTPWEKYVSDGAYDKVIPVSLDVRHELIRCGEMIRGLGNVYYLARLPYLLNVETIPPMRKPYGVIYAGGSWSEKCWETEKFAMVCDWIVEHTGMALYLCGGPNDIEKTCDVQSRMKQKSLIINVAGKHNLCQSVEVIRNASFVFGNDTGAIHIAAICRVPSVAIVVGRELGRFFPYETESNIGDEKFPIPVFSEMPCAGCLYRGEKDCPYMKQTATCLPCIEKISVSQVISALEQILKGEDE